MIFLCLISPAALYLLFQNFKTQHAYSWASKTQTIFMFFFSIDFIFHIVHSFYTQTLQAQRNINERCSTTTRTVNRTSNIPQLTKWKWNPHSNERIKFRNNFFRFYSFIWKFSSFVWCSKSFFFFFWHWLKYWCSLWTLFSFFFFLSDYLPSSHFIFDVLSENNRKTTLLAVCLNIGR